MHPIGYSTGAIAFGDFRTALERLRLRSAAVEAIELSALREGELRPLLEAVPSLDLKAFRYVSIHAPSAFDPANEIEIIYLLSELAPADWPIIVHPDAIRDFGAWRTLGANLCIENMDKRKPIGRTASDLSKIFRQLPNAGLCFDVGHARQVDPTMCTALMILREHGHRLRQLHVSEVDTQSRHHRMTLAGSMAFRKVAPVLPPDAVVIIESIVAPQEIELEVQNIRKVLADESQFILMTD